MVLLYFVISFCLAVAVIAELCFGLSGLMVPLTAISGFYFTVTQRWDRAVIPFLVASTVLDLSYGRLAPLSMLLVPLVLVAGSYWRIHGNTRSLATQVLPGCMIGVGAFITTSLYAACYGMNSGRILDFLPFRTAVQCFASGGCAMPILVIILDTVMRAFGYRRYSTYKSFVVRGEIDE
ncbi:MAG: hypothetical protein IJS15_13775 [Victivallales bacterium]|nr:hypothetical protein [Victivallales bacterium]